MYRINWTEEKKIMWKKAAWKAVGTTCSIIGTTCAVLFIVFCVLLLLATIFVKGFPYTLPILPIVALIFGCALHSNIQEQKAQ